MQRLETTAGPVSIMKLFPQKVCGSGRFSVAEAYDVLFVEEGNLRVNIDFCEMLVGAGQLLAIAPGQVWRIDADDSLTAECLSFSDRMFGNGSVEDEFLHTAAMFDSFRRKGAVMARPVNAKELFSIIRQECARADDISQGKVLRSYLLSLLYGMEREYSEGFSDDSYSEVRAFRGAVEQSFRINRNADYYISQQKVNEKSLSRQLRKYLGMTPKAYIDARIILEAKRLLACGDCSVKIISRALGFTEQSNFNKYFRKFAGVTPATFRMENSFMQTQI